MKVMINHSRSVASELWQKKWWNKFRAMFFTIWSLFDAWWLHHLMSLNLWSRTTQSNKLCWNLNIYIYIYMCVCVCVERERERERESHEKYHNFLHNLPYCWVVSGENVDLTNPLYFFRQLFFYRKNKSDQPFLTWSKLMSWIDSTVVE